MELLKNKMFLWKISGVECKQQMKGQATQTGRIYLQYIYLVKGLYLEYTKHSFNLLIKQPKISH